MDLIKNERSIRWMDRCNALFITKDYSSYEKLGYIKDFERIYKCVDTKEMKKEEIETFLQTKTNFSRFIFQSSSVKGVNFNESKISFMWIPLVSGNEDIFINSPFGFPIFTGWFCNNIVQKELHYYRRRYLKEILEVDNVRDQLKKLSGELGKYWIKQKSRLHVTAMFIGGKADEPIKNYLNKVNKQFYTTYKVKVIGILLTPRNISVHVKIPGDVKWMFDPKLQDVFTLITHMTLATAKDSEPVDSGPDQVNVQKMIQDNKKPIQEFDLKIGKLQDWGESRFYVVLKKSRNYELMFLPFVNQMC